MILSTPLFGLKPGLKFSYDGFLGSSGKTQDLEEQQPSVEQQLRRLMDKPGEVFRGTPPPQRKWGKAEGFCLCAEHLKTEWDRKKEAELMEKLLEIINDRNAIVEGLDEDRLRWAVRMRKSGAVCRLLFLDPVLSF